MNPADEQEKLSLAILGLLFAVLTIAVVGASALSYSQFASHIRAQVAGQLTAVADLKANQLSNWRDERLRAEAEILHQNSRFAADVQRFRESPRDLLARQQLQSWLKSYRAHSEYRRVSLLDMDGQPRLADSDTPAPIPAAVRAATSTALQSSHVTMVDFYRGDDNQQISLAVLIPILDPRFSQRVIGLIAVEIDPQVSFYSYLSQWPIPSTSAETLLVRREGDDLLVVSELRFQPDAALRVRSPLRAADLTAGQAEVITGQDYRGAPVVADVRAVSNSPWLLVTKIDEAEAYAPLRERQWQLALFIGVVMTAIGSGLALIWRQQNLRDYRRQRAALTAIHASERQMRALVTSLDDLVFELDAQGVCLNLWAADEGLLFLPREQLIGRQLLGFADDELKLRYADMLQRVLASGRPESAEYPLEIAGEQRWFSARISPILPTDDSPQTASVLIRDISEHKRAEQANLRYSEQLATVVAVEHALAASLDQEAIYATLARAIHQLFPDMTTIFISRYDAEREMITAMYGIHEGELLDVSALPEIPLLPPGQGTQSQVIHTRQPLIISDNLNDHLGPGPVVRVGTPGEYTQSAAYVPMLAQDTVLGIMQLQSVVPSRLTEADARVLGLLANTAAVSIQNARLYALAQREIAERTQAEETLRASEHSLKLAQQGLLELNRTLEERVRQRAAEAQTLSETLRRANADLARAARAKDEFLANMSHELRTPLNAILSFSELLLEQVRGPITAGQQAAIRDIAASGQHLLTLINDILDLSKVEAGRLDLQVEPVAISEVCQASLLFVKELALKKSLRLDFTLNDQLAVMQADPKRLKQMLVNLLSNAVKFTPERGTVRLAVDADAEAGAIRFAVEDNGIGISPEDLARLFQPFSQLESSLSRQHEGSGLGLALVQRLAELHGGSIVVESAVGVGSCFTISLPYLPSTPQKAPAAPGAAAKADPDSPAPAGVRILLAEDNPANVLALDEYLNARGYQVILAKNGREALRQVEEAPPDLILMDIQMPELDGLEAIRLLRTRPVGETIPIVALTALAMPGDRERCLAAGANAYLTKPVSLRELVRLIASLVCP